MILNGCRLGFYEPLRESTTNFIFKDPKVQSLGVNVFSGATSGMLGAACGSPFFLVKTRLQSYSPFLPVGTQHGYSGAVDGLLKISRTEGIKGLYRGVGAAMIRTGFGSSVQLPTYFFAKRRLVKHLGMQEGLPLHLASSTASGIVVCIFMHPPGLTYPALVVDGADELHRYCHVQNVQSDWQSVQRCIRLLVQDDTYRRTLCNIQRILRASGQDIAAYNTDLDSGRADEQANEKVRG